MIPLMTRRLESRMTIPYLLQFMLAEEVSIWRWNGGGYDRIEQPNSADIARLRWAGNGDDSYRRLKPAPAKK